MPVTKLLDNNAAFLKRGYAPGVPPADKLLLISDSDPRLTGVLEPALGLSPGQAVQIRLAGAQGGDDGKELFRSVLLAVHQEGCREAVVVGCRGSFSCPADRQRLRQSFHDSGLDSQLELLGGGSELLDRLQGPDSPEQAVRLTVKLLRERLLPAGIPVSGLLLDPDTGRLEAIDDLSTEQQELFPAPTAPVEPTASDIPDVAMPELPEIRLPDIPPLDIDAVMAESARQQQEARRTAVSYGQGGSGPVSFADLAAGQADGQLGQGDTQAMPPSLPHQQVQVSNIEYEQPAPVQVADTGLEYEQHLRATSGAVSRPDVTAVPTAKPRPHIKARPKVKARPGARTRPEQPQVTPLVRQRQGAGKVPPAPPAPPVMPPLKERVINFDDDAEKTPVPRRQAIRVDLDRGWVQVEGADMPLDPRLQASLLKVKRFLARELSRQSLSRLAQSVRRRSLAGEPAGELLKAIITPVLRLGKKRYAVINDLLTLKEQLPRLEGRVAAIVIEKLVGG